MSNTIFSVQDRTGTVAQLTINASPGMPVDVGDTGIYTGTQPWSGNTVSFPFSVCQVNDAENFSITTALPDNAGPGNVLQSGWPPTGTIKWLTGDNAVPSPGDDSVVTAMAPANAYISPDFMATYNNSRGQFLYNESPADQITQAIVQATDYIDQWYRFKGIKLLQFLSANPNVDLLIPFIDPWLTPFGFGQFQYWTPSTTVQHTEWPRQGCVDYNGDSVYGVPLVVQNACAELALRALNGVTLQADYDAAIVGQGGIIETQENQVGPIRTSTTYDTKLGIGFFPDFPHVTRMLAKAGVLIAGGGRSILR
jgi:hypothetical protein